MKRLLIVGSGKRVREAALPALHRIAAGFSVRGVFARTKKSIEVEGRKYDVEPLAELDARAMSEADLVYVAVGKDSVPRVLAHLTALDVSRVDVLVDTPVVRFKHFRHAALLARFRNAWVAEDCSYLPWFDVVRAACAPGSSAAIGSSGEPGPIGQLKRVVFDRSAYAYHGLASAKTLFASDSIVRGRRTLSSNGSARRVLELSGGGRAVIVEPRDYSVGSIVIEGERGIASDRKLEPSVLAELGAPASTSVIPIEVVVERNSCVGFRIGTIETHLSAEESSLAAGDPAELSLTARMGSMKRVGFLRLLRAIDARRGAYPIQSGIDDMVVDYYLEKLGIWRSTSLTNPRSSLGRAILSTVSRIGGG
jgi:hypothetical protein